MFIRVNRAKIFHEWTKRKNNSHANAHLTLFFPRDWIEERDWESYEVRDSETLSLSRSIWLTIGDRRLFIIYAQSGLNCHPY